MLFPLDWAYAQVGLAAPTARVIDRQCVPAAYAPLLVHVDDMTGTLERHHGQRVNVRPLWSVHRRRWYARRVLLSRADSGRPVSLGAIRIRLDVFEEEVRQRIIDGRIPLGRILVETGLEFRSQPKAFFELEPNAEMLGVLWMPEPKPLYGRQGELSLGGESIGAVVEVIPRNPDTTAGSERGGRD